MVKRQVGTLKELHRYPVKSMGEESLQSVTVDWHGLAGDRRWAFIRPDAERSGFPWFTIREKPDLWHYRPRFVNPEDVESSKVMVKTPEGDELEVADPELARRLGDGIRVIKQYAGIFDTFPLSFLTIQSIQSLSGLSGKDLTPLRFRPSLVIDSTEGAEFPEEGWEGAILSVGTLRCRLDARDKRCTMVNVEPSSLDSTPQVLRAIAQQRAAHFGMYGTTVEPGQIAVGDPVFLEA